MKHNRLCVKQFSWNNLIGVEQFETENFEIKKFIIKISERGDIPKFSTLKGGAPPPSGGTYQRVPAVLRGYGLNIAVL